MLELKNINVSFRSERQDKIFGHTRQQVLFDVSLTVKEGTCLGILGESGSGKSTMGRVLCGLLKPDSGEAVLDGVSVYASRAGRRNLQNKLSIVFQDYTTSANPRFRIRDIIGEGLTVQERREGKKLDRKTETSRLLELVGLPADFADRFPHELSGGQLQRVCIARAVACKPEIILFDEAISSLDADCEDVLRLMNHLGIIKEDFNAIHQTEITKAVYEEAPADGYWFPEVCAGQKVLKEALLGRWKSSDGTQSCEVRARFAGRVLYETTALGVRRNDPLIAYGTA